MVSLIDSQKDNADSGVDPGFGKIGAFVTGSTGGAGAIEAGVGVRWAVSAGCEGSVATGGSADRGAAVDAGDGVAMTMADNLSSFLSISATRFGV